MIKNEHLWIAEVVEISSNNSLILELFNKDYNLIQNPFLSIYENTDEIIYCVIRTYKDSIDPTRKPVALNMSESEIQKEHPEHSFLIKPYLTAILIGTVCQDIFFSGIQKFNIGLHSRFEITSPQTISWFLKNKSSLLSLVNLFLINPFLKPHLKTLCSLWIKNIDIANTKPLLLSSLSYLLRDDYFQLKELAEYIK